MMRERTALSLAYNQSVKELEDLNQGTPLFDAFHNCS